MNTDTEYIFKGLLLYALFGLLYQISAIVSESNLDENLGFPHLLQTIALIFCLICLVAYFIEGFIKLDVNFFFKGLVLFSLFGVWFELSYVSLSSSSIFSSGASSEFSLIAFFLGLFSFLFFIALGIDKSFDKSSEKM